MRGHTAVHAHTRSKRTYSGGWWHIAVWLPELQLWGHLRRARPRGYKTACFHGCRRHTRVQSACWCCSESDIRCLRSQWAGSTCSSHAGWNLPSVSLCWQCYLRKDANCKACQWWDAWVRWSHRKAIFISSPGSCDRQLVIIWQRHLDLLAPWFQRQIETQLNE